MAAVKPGIADIVKNCCGSKFIIDGLFPDKRGIGVQKRGMPAAVFGNGSVYQIIQKRNAKGGDCCYHGSGQNDSDNGYEGPGTIFFQSLEGYLVKYIHERATCLSSRTTFPSAMQIIRSAWSAIFSSCVTMMSVW